MKSEIFPELEKLYNNKNPLVRGIFCGRLQTALSFANINDNSILLDIGCGTGHLLKSIRQSNIRCECWGTDVIEFKEIETLNFKFQVADVRSLPFHDNYFNIIFTLDVLEHIKDDVDAAINEIHRVLIPNGVAILSGPTESLFYRFCRSILFNLSKKNSDVREPSFRREIDHHFHSIYDLEQKFVGHGFKLVRRRSLPSLPLPSLFRVSKFLK